LSLAVFHPRGDVADRIVGDHRAVLQSALIEHLDLNAAVLIDIERSIEQAVLPELPLRDRPALGEDHAFAVQPSVAELCGLDHLAMGPETARFAMQASVLEMRGFEEPPVR